jgi:glycosyltransferase
MTLPALTIITPSRNGERYVEEALDSVQRQRYPKLEHLVMDGGSTDATVRIVAARAGVTLVSEPDEGSHHAMNKGLARASGEVVGFLNVDDLYPDGVLHEVGRLMAADPSLDVVVGQSVVFEDDDSGRHVVSWRTHSRANGLWVPELTFGVPGFCGCFFRRTVFERVGKLNNDYDFTGDRHMLIRVALAGMNAALLGRPTIWYRMHARSRTINRQKTHLREISREHFRMAREFAKLAGANEELRRCFLAWHALAGAKLVLRDLIAGRGAAAIDTFVTLGRHDPAWTLRLAHALALRAAVRRLDSDAPAQRAPCVERAQREASS